MDDSCSYHVCLNQEAEPHSVAWVKFLRRGLIIFILKLVRRCVIFLWVTFIWLRIALVFFVTFVWQRLLVVWVTFVRQRLILVLIICVRRFLSFEKPLFDDGWFLLLSRSFQSRGRSSLRRLSNVPLTRDGSCSCHFCSKMCYFPLSNVCST